MAANLQSRGIATIGKRFIVAQLRWAHHFQAPPPAAASLASARRSVHISTYDKNLDESVRPVVVPDDVIEAESDKYWEPHPTTGVFGPSQDAAGSATTGHPAAPGDGSVLEQKVWFRPLEDVDKPQSA